VADLTTPSARRVGSPVAESLLCAAAADDPGPEAQMSDTDCVQFLQWALPRLRMRWPGFRKVRRQVCRRIERRTHELGLPDLVAYHRYLESQPAEWTILDSLCHVTISRFCRDRQTFVSLERKVLPVLADGALAAGTKPSMSGARAAPPARSPTRSRFCGRSSSRGDSRSFAYGSSRPTRIQR
jgi:hypothetical protein